MRISRTEAIKIDHPFFSERLKFFDDRVMGLMPKFFSDAETYMEVLAESRRKGVLPYFGDNKILNVAVFGKDLEKSLANTPRLKGTEMIAVPVNDSQIKVLDDKLVERYSF